MEETPASRPHFGLTLLDPVREEPTQRRRRRIDRIRLTLGMRVLAFGAVVAIARRGGIDVLTNEVSNRLTACMVGFSGKERKLGEQALSGVRANGARNRACGRGA